MLVILKIPVLYLCAVVWWAIKAEPRPLAGAHVGVPLDPPPGCDWKRRNGPRRSGPRGGRGGRLARSGQVRSGQVRRRRVATAQTQVRRMVDA